MYTWSLRDWLCFYVGATVSHSHVDVSDHHADAEDDDDENDHAAVASAVVRHPIGCIWTRWSLYWICRFPLQEFHREPCACWLCLLYPVPKNSSDTF